VRASVTNHAEATPLSPRSGSSMQASKRAKLGLPPLDVTGKPFSHFPMPSGLEPREPREVRYLLDDWLALPARQRLRLIEASTPRPPRVAPRRQRRASTGATEQALPR
jgi:hypothetical protein